LSSHNAVAESKLRTQVRDRLSGYGPLQPLLEDPAIEEILINCPLFCDLK
jgi:Flp pilus assembly CpaF family ATPase